MSEHHVSNFDVTRPEKVDPRVELANSAYDLPIKDSILYNSLKAAKHNPEDEDESPNQLKAQEARIYDFLDRENVHPVNVKQFLEDSRSF